MSGKLDIVFGGQYGSCGKGVIVAHIANRYQVHVRVGAPNAGHSFLGPDGLGGKRLWKMQTIPCGWINPNALILIGAGGLIDPELLRREVEEIAQVDASIYNRLLIDANCGVLDKCFHEQEGGINGEMHIRIGSTGEGVGPAREARISRDPKRFRLYKDLCQDDSWFGQFEHNSIATLIVGQIHRGCNVLLEGAQGQGLSLIHGPWPYCTSTDPGPAQLCADVGVPLKAVRDIIVCMRTFPIRVAGNSGPLYAELSWDELSQRLGKTICERTTVTKKIRRIGLWDESLARQCVMLHGPTKIALTFVDYLTPEDEGISKYDNLSAYARNFIMDVQRQMGVPVAFIGTGGPQFVVMER